jgi:two-component system sensor histidine kinase/response regulator
LLVRTDGATVPILKRVISIDPQGKAQLLESFIDISQLKHTQTDLEIALAAAREANLTKGEFLANMSHEIRTPMNGIIGLTNIMLRTHLDRDQLEYMQTIQNSADSLLRIVNDILDFSKIESGTLEIEKLDFDLQATVESAVNALACTAHEKGLEFSFLIDPVVPIHLIGDPGRLRQVLLNLLNNAVKFTARGEVFLSVTLEKKDLSAVCLKFSIKDTGIGIPSDRLGLIFNSFSQVDATTTRKYGETGSGLAISKNLVEMMDGAIEVQSTVGQGSVFMFTAQFQRQWQTRTHPLAHEHPLIGAELQDKRILCVDDNRTNLMVLQGYLQFWDLRFSLAESADQALGMMRRAVGHKDPYHLVIMDHMMPGVDGTALGSAIRAEAAIGGVKMILLTSMGSEIKIQELEQIGFDGCLTKPIHMRHFHNCLLLVFKNGPAKSNASSSGPDKAQMITPQVVDCTISNGFRILVVEDNFINQKIVEKILGMHGYQTEIACNGQEAVRMLSTKIFDPVLMDIQMPLMNGLEATAAIRDQAGPCKNNQVPIVALTANAMPADRHICLNAGMDDYIPKPVNPNILIATLKRWLDRPTDPNEASMAG